MQKHAVIAALLAVPFALSSAEAADMGAKDEAIKMAVNGPVSTSRPILPAKP